MSAQEPAAATAATPMDIDDKDESKQVSSRRSSSSHSSAAPTNAQLRRTIKLIQGDQEEQADGIIALKRQLLWNMQQQVRSDRRACSTQVVVQGYAAAAAAEAPDMSQAMRDRDAAPLDLFSQLTKLPTSRLTFTSSHAVGVDQLSRLSIITFSDGAMAGHVLRSAGARKFEYKGAYLTIRRQTAAFDRLCSAPAKIAMELASAHSRPLESRFVPQWKEGLVYNAAFHPTRALIKWTVNIESSKIKLWAAEPYMDAVQSSMETRLRRLQFGAAAAGAEGEAHDPESSSAPFLSGKGKGKGKKGKSKKPRASVPTDASAFRRESNPIVRDSLGCLHFAKYPFTVVVKKYVYDDDEQRRTTSATNPGASSSKKRAPTPTRQGQEEGGDRHRHHHQHH